MGYLNHKSIKDVFLDLKNYSDKKIFKNKLISEKLEELLEDYEKTLEINLDHKKIFLKDLYNQTLENTKNKQITTFNLKEFTEKLIMYQNKKNFKINTGIFISCILKNLVYKPERIDLDFTRLRIKIDYLGYKNENLNFSIRGNLGDRSFNYAKNINARINGNIENYAFYNCENSTFNVLGNVACYGAQEIKDSKIKVLRNVKNHFGVKSSNSIFEINGNIDNHSFNDAKKIQATIKGDVKNNLAKNCIDSKIYIRTDKKIKFKEIGKGTTIYNKGIPILLID